MAKIHAKKTGYQRKHYLSFARKVSETGRILSKNGRPEIFAKNGRCQAKLGGLESLLHVVN